MSDWIDELREDVGIERKPEFYSPCYNEGQIDWNIPLHVSKVYGSTETLEKYYSKLGYPKDYADALVATMYSATTLAKFSPVKKKAPITRADWISSIRKNVGKKKREQFPSLDSKGLAYYDKENRK
jgi:hypothetical protein